MKEKRHLQVLTFSVFCMVLSFLFFIHHGFYEKPLLIPAFSFLFSVIVMFILLAQLIKRYSHK